MLVRLWLLQDEELLRREAAVDRSAGKIYPKELGGEMIRCCGTVTLDEVSCEAKQSA